MTYCVQLQPNHGQVRAPVQDTTIPTGNQQWTSQQISYNTHTITLELLKHVTIVSSFLPSTSSKIRVSPHEPSSPSPDQMLVTCWGTLMNSHWVEFMGMKMQESSTAQAINGDQKRRRKHWKMSILYLVDI